MQALPPNNKLCATILFGASKNKQFKEFIVFPQLTRDHHFYFYALVNVVAAK
jgi:hypothetical protein